MDPKPEIRHDEDKASDSDLGVASPVDQHPHVEKTGTAAGVDAEVEKQLLKKLDRRIIPMICWIYLMNFMDRVNIGNARLYRLEEDLNMSGDQYQLAVSILFVTYVIFETPSNMIIKRLQPARFLTGLVLCWGMVATFSAFCNNYAALIACRLLLGVFESGLFPGVILYLSMFYNKKSLSLRQAYFYGTSAIAGAVGGLVAYAIGDLDGTAGWSGWRWVFMINGVPTVLTAFFVPFVLPNSPETAKFLSEEDQRNMILLRSSELGQTRAAQEFDKKDVWDACFTLSVFLPTIIDGMGAGWSRQVVQAMTIPVYFAGFASYIACAWYSDKIQQRGLFIISGLLVCIVGYVLLIINRGAALSYTGTFFVALGLWVATGLAFSWIVVNNPRYGKRAFASGMQITIGNCSGVAAPFLFSQPTAPTYYPGYGATLGMLGLGVILFTSLHFYFRVHNRKKREGKYDHLMQGKTEEEIEEMGEKNPRYMYTI